jgi:hypothetical protein
MAKLLNSLATWAFVARPAGQEADVALVLPDGMWTSAIGLELDEESLERIRDRHRRLLGIGSWN